MTQADIIIVGTGQAGAQAAVNLRQHGFSGSIILVGDEPDAPYERPPLSKAYLAGELAAERLALRLASFWPAQDITLLVGKRVAAVNAAGHELSLEDGSRLGYGRLIWAAGGSPRLLTCPGADLAGVHVVRTRAQVDALKTDLAAARNIAIIGGGYIGLETAAVLAKTGKTVTVLEAQPRLLARVAGRAISEFYHALHGGHGVNIRVNTAVTALAGTNGRVRSVTLADGSEIPADLVIVGIGLIPEIAPLLQAGAVCGNGVEVDEFCSTSLPDIYAIGDCAAAINEFAGGVRMRLESVPNAVDQARIATDHILGRPHAGLALPWFWSNQYDIRLQTAGLNINFDQEVLRGDPATSKFSVVYLREGKVVALDCINAVKDFIQGKQLIQRASAIPAARLADAGIELKLL